MKESIKGFILSVFIISLLVACWLGAAYAAWDWIEPNGFWEILQFIFTWGILFKGGLLFLFMIIYSFFD